ncbi:MAG: mandelate racemase/muconate lactonizing enzyme family protein, partial [Candidatus Bathyarchaeia archaeon]
LSSAQAAIDIALWDILGKHAGLPIYQLLGGRFRERCRTFQTVGGRTPEEVAERASAAVKEGFTVLRVFALGPEGPTIVQSSDVAQAAEKVRAVREAVGDRVDVGVEVHRAFTPLQAVTFAQAVEKYNVLFIEDPVPPESVEAMLYVATHTCVPIAAGERCYDVHGFKELIDRRIAGLIRPDVTVAGGITESRKIAAIAEASEVQLMPHLMSSPIGTAAFLHLDAAVPNYAFQEYAYEKQQIRQEIVKPALRDEPGYAYVPDGPGLGLELNEEAAAKYPYKRYELQGLYYEDGSLAEF